jgi:A/G-specific adenine glycosylase
VRALVRPLLDWFGANARDLPWRRTGDPYAIWISEIMLQQTQVKTVAPYWQRWMRAFPNVRSLARARPDRVLKLWEGLGYYSRARNLQTAAQRIVREADGRFPDKFEEVLALPGIGRYTAGAICSIAFNQPTPVLDGNVIRVLTRIFGIGDNPREKRTAAKLWGLAERAVREAAPLGRCSQLNQSLMELGALLCTPREPGCTLCPVQSHCAAFRLKRTDRLPNLGKRVGATRRRFAAFLVARQGRFLVRQRPSGGVNGRLWEFPNVEVDGGQPDEWRLGEIVPGLRPVSIRPLHQVRHTITRYRITLDVFGVEFANGPSPLVSIRQRRWCSLAELEKLAFPSAHRNIVNWLRAGGYGCLEEPHGAFPSR